MKTGPKPRDVMERLWEKTQTIPFCGCYVFTGALHGGGYGALWDGKRLGTSHIIAYERLVGPVPEGLELDHKCRVRACWNPAHLEPVTTQVNLLRGVGVSAKAAQATQCPYGHPYSGDNLYRYPDGHRGCRACNRDWQQRYRDRPKSERVSA